jgi:hypothetical protein
MEPLFYMSMAARRRPRPDRLTPRRQAARTSQRALDLRAHALLPFILPVI